MQKFLTSWVGLSRPIRDPTHPEDPTGDRSETDRSDYSGGRRRVSASRTRKRRVGWRIFSPKPEETRPNRDLRISRRSYLHLARSQPFPARSQLDPWNLHWIWRDLAESDEISTNSKKIQRKYHRNFADFAVKSLDFGRFSDLQLRPNRPPSIEGPICSIWSTMPIGDGLNFWPTDLVGLVSSWAHTWPRPTHGQA